MLRSLALIGMGCVLSMMSASFVMAAVPGPAPKRLSLDELLRNPPLDQLHHTAWGAREGVFGPVYGLAQTTDGYLWLGTDRGLLRFDGERFEPFASIAGESLQGRGILTLYATPDNGLWIGYLSGGLALVREGHVVLEENAKPGGFQGATRGFAQEKDGTLWVASSRGLFKRSGDTWHRMGKAEGCPDSGQGLFTKSVDVDPAGNVWVNIDKRALVRPAGQQRFVELVLPEKDAEYMTLDPQGRMWANTQRSVGQKFHMRYFRLPRPQVPGDVFDSGHPVHNGLYMPIFDRDGYLWYGAGDGVTRERLPETSPPASQELAPEAQAAPPLPLVPLSPTPNAAAPHDAQSFRFSQPALQRLTRNQRLTGDEVLRILQDREGNIWIGTNGGLDRLRRTRVSTFQFPVGMSTPAMALGRQGDLWFTSRNGIFHLPLDGKAADLVSYPLPSPSLTRVAVDHAGTVWLGDRNGLSRLGPDGHNIDERRDAFPDWRGTLMEIAEARSGALWVSAQAMGLLRRLPDGSWERLQGNKGFPADAHAKAIALDQQGRSWLGYEDGMLLRVDEGDRITTFTQKEGLRVGDVLALAAGDRHVWVAGAHGLQRVDDAGFHEVWAAAADAFNGVSGLLETPQGDLWLNGAEGITRIEAADLKRAIADPDYRVPLMKLDTSDGLPGRAETMWPLRTALQTPDGHLWFTVTNGVVVVDPATLAGAPAASTALQIQRVSASGTPVTPHQVGLVQPPAGTQDLQIDYTSLSLAMPERIRFKYRLSGLETSWHDAGARRQAYYSNLGPGRYVFEVLGTDADGVWSPKPATLAIEIPPTFVQSLTFRALCAVLALALIALLVLMRLRQLEARAAERYLARLNERTRIAQDLHDTLLQGFQGLVLRFQRVAWGIPEALPARAEMERVLDRADEIVIEGRHRVTDLRQEPSDSRPLEQTLESLGNDLASFHEASFEMRLDGESRPLAAGVHGELALVAREALFNAFQHSKATRIEAHVTYAETGLSMSVSDDGVGVPPQTQANGQRPGHWGLSGMRERVTRVGGSFALRSPPGGSTQLVVSVPAAQAYLSAGENPGSASRLIWRMALFGRRAAST
ncbi:MAG TPA: two-component regulator propeller domain-containing protein [Burkholderiaceae bacterium]|jgi:signal transduction histidine kinase/ligand-binding sensor domain-containing protein